MYNQVNELERNKMNKNIPRSKHGNNSPEMIKQRRDFISEKTGIQLNHIDQYTIETKKLKGNIENFIGAAQVPIGIAGPLLVNGKYAQGEFYVPLATTEGTLVASYNRGMKILYECGGAITTISDDVMQRAPVFIFKSAREAKNFGRWIRENFHEIKKIAEKTTRIGKLRDIEQYPSNKFLFLRFNYHTGDAAGQNMTTKATFFACEWIRANYPYKINHYILESNLATDKKASKVNMLRTRGKRVTAEVVIPEDILKNRLNSSSYRLQRGLQITTVASFMAGSVSNAYHSANGITAMFIATGQDVANVAESSAGVMFSEMLDDGDFYCSITIPSLIVATYGGGTGLATQKECLDVMDCYGPGKVKKLAEIVAATALAGEISLMAAIYTKEWVSSHEKLGRNR
ncbi:MAG: hydroxymethylglutaryl-CoA reductase [Candidatus Odinarchaeota archaeon]